MTFLEKLKEIDFHLGKIHQVNENIGSSGSFTSLENDIVKDHLRKLYELYDELRSMKSLPVPGPEPVVVPQAAPQDAAVETPEPIVMEEVVEAAESPEPAAETAPEETEDGSVSLFEKFKTASKEVNTSSLSDKPLKEIIPLNDKFMFIKEFFDNSISKYDEMLEKVENAGKKDSAVNYMKDNVWSPEIFEKNEELIDRFIRILDTKFKD